MMAAYKASPFACFPVVYLGAALRSLPSVTSRAVGGKSSLNGGTGILTALVAAKIYELTAVLTSKSLRSYVFLLNTSLPGLGWRMPRSGPCSGSVWATSVASRRLLTSAFINVLTADWEPSMVLGRFLAGVTK